MARGKKKEAGFSPEERLRAALVPESEQLYKVPENWCWVKLSALSQVISKGTTPKGGKNAYSDQGVKFLRVENINDDGTISHENIAYVSEELHCTFLKRSILEENDILVSIAGTLGKTGIIRNMDLPMNTNQAVAFVRIASDKINRKYIKNAIDNPVIQNLLLSKTKVTSIPNLTLEIIGECPMPLPPFAEQQRIVDRIESLFAKLGEARQKAQDVLDRFETRKAAILHKAFTGELTAQWRKEHGVGMESWKDLLLGDVFVLQAGKNISANKIKRERDEIYRYPCFGGNGIRGYVELYNRQGLHPIIGRQGALCGNINQAEGYFYATEHAVVVDYKLKVNTTWAVQYLKFLNLNQYATATAQPGLAVSNIVKLLIKYPVYDEQKVIGNILGSLLAKEQQAKEAAEKVLEQIDLTKKAILARAFRGELGTNDPSEENAVVLIENIITHREDQNAY